MVAHSAQRMVSIGALYLKNYLHVHKEIKITSFKKPKR